MKQLSKIFILSMILVFAFQQDAFAQKRRKKKKSKKDNTETFAQHLWYGGSFNLGFSSNSIEKLFQIGVSPMVGYKITPKFSLGPRASINYIDYRIRSSGQVESAGFANYGIGAFSRYKIVPIIFAHVEYERENYGLADINNTGGLDVDRQSRNNTFVGLGYTEGYSIMSYEILILYNLTLPDDVFESPWVIRFGFNYKFND